MHEYNLWFVWAKKFWNYVNSDWFSIWGDWHNFKLCGTHLPIDIYCLPLSSKCGPFKSLILFFERDIGKYTSDIRKTTVNWRRKMASDNQHLETRNKRQTGEECVPIFRGHTCGQRPQQWFIRNQKSDCGRKLTKYQVLVQLKKNKTLKIKEDSLPINQLYF